MPRPEDGAVAGPGDDMTGARPSNRTDDAPRRGRLFVVSAPSGAGKTTLCRSLRDHFPDLAYSVSFTTRAPRPGERDGVDYRFIPVDEFRRGIEEGRWAEWAEVHGNYYGTSAAALERTLAEGRDLLLEIDVQGCAQIAARFPETVAIFVMPPSFEALRERLTGRGQDDPEVVERRLRAAGAEMDRAKEYRHVIVNDRLETARAELIGVVAAAREKG
jgi:guanylate kinase